MLRSTTYALGLIGLVALGGWVGISQAVITPPAAPPPASPGDALTLPFIVKNTSPERDIFDFSLEVSPGLEPLGVPEPVELDPSAEETVFVSVFVSTKARAGAGFVTLKARSRKNPSLIAQASVTVTVKESPGLELIAPPTKTVEPGSTERIVFIVRNRGNVPDRVAFALQITGLLRAQAPTEITLDVGERREIPIEVSIPKGAPPVRQHVTLKAVSKKFENVSAEATAVLEVLPPLPQDVGGSLFLTIPSQTGFQLDGQTAFTVGASVAIRESGGTLLPDRPAVRLSVGGTLTLDNTSAAAITVTVSDGRPPVTIPSGASSSLAFPVSGIFTVIVSNGALIPSTIIVTVQDSVFRQTLSGTGQFQGRSSTLKTPELRAFHVELRTPEIIRSQDEESRIAYTLDIENLFELNTIFFGLDMKPVGFAMGDLYLPVSSLATVFGRGGQVTVRPGFFSAKLSLTAVAAQRILTEAEFPITDDPTGLPTSATVSLNQPIRFRNVGLAPHTVTVPGSGSITLAPGQSFVHAFSAVGQVTVTIDMTPVVFTVIAEAFCGASFLFCIGAEGQGVFIPGVTIGQAALFGFTSSSSLTTTLLSNVRWQIPGGSATTVEGGLTFQNGTFLDSALRITSELRMGDFAIFAQFLRAGRDFAGDRRDEQGIALFQTFSTPTFSLWLGFERTRNNINNDPLQQTLTRQEARAFLSLKLSEIFPTLRLSTVYSTLVGVGPLPPTDLSRFGFTAQMIQPIGKLGDISVFTEQAFFTNAIAGTETGFGTVGGEFSIRLTELRASVRFEHRSEVDLLLGTLLSQQLVTSAGVELLRRPFGVRLGWTRFTDRFDVSTALQARLGIATLFFSGLSSFLDSGAKEFSFALAVALQFDATIPFIVINGRVEGFVFLDTNSNGQRDPNETGPKNLILLLGNEKARTDEHGFFRFPPMEPGTYELKIEKLPTGIVVKTTLPQKVRIVAGQTLKLEIPLAQVAVIEGVVFHDEDRDGQLDSSEQGLGSVRVFLTDATGKTRDQRTDSDGRFAFSELLPGTYTVALDVRSLPQDFSLTTPAEVTVELKAQEHITVNFGATERPRTVKFPPVAQFEFTPERPKVGETVHFDASESFDPDGQIIKYEWDFESDGAIDAQGVRVEHSFNQAGTFTVTLTVTDNDGETGTARKTITVRP